jgi:hypothetical protein
MAVPEDRMVPWGQWAARRLSGPSAAVASPKGRSLYVLPIIREIQRSVASLHQIADALNARGIATARGGLARAV